MDAKALAKSKRAHSLHHSKKHHLNPSSKAPVGSGTASSSKKPTGKLEKQKPSQSQGLRALPSNRDRYEEEYDSGSEDTPNVSASQASDVVAPKSKGADYTHLISEAKAQYQSNYSSDSFTLFNDVLDELNQGFGPLLSVKGQRMVSWISDDNFPLDDKETSSYEASFLSLNLDSLAEQLAKANLAERLFIEPDLLPPNLCTEIASSERNQDEGQATSGTLATENVVNAVASNGILVQDKNIHQSSEYTYSESGKGGRLLDPTSSNEGFLNHSEDKLWQSSETPHSTSERLSSDLTADSFTKKPSRFEAAAAEAELDMLLDSFGETKFLDSPSVTEQSSHRSYMPQGSSVLSVSVPMQHPKEGDNIRNFEMVSTNLDDTIDDLLKESSNPINMKGVSPLQEVKPASRDTPSASHSGSDSKSKVLDDFESWLETI